MSRLFVNKHIEIKNSTVAIDGQVDFSSDQDSFLPFAKAAYKNYGIKYGKFYKMDPLSKLGFLASELLLQDANKDYASEEVALVFANASSSLNTDAKYQGTIQDVPSPSVFVYTLPNIVIGEICIRHNFKGETMFFVQDEFDLGFTCNYVNNIFENTNTKMCITGWVEMSEEGQYHADLYLVSEEESDTEFNQVNINLSYKK